jgi:hypothetical protein
VDLKLAFQSNPTFKRQLQQKARGIVEKLVKQAREFALEIKQRIAVERADENRKVVLIVDSFERLGSGSFDNSAQIFNSAETLFGSQADKLRFSGVTTVYTVPPYISGLTGGLGAHYACGRIYALPSVHIYARCPAAGEVPQPYPTGIRRMVETIEKRYPGWQQFFRLDQLERLAKNSGGDLRDFFRMLRLAIVGGRAQARYPVPDEVIESAEDAVRNDMLPIAEDDRRWLSKIMHSHRHQLPDRSKLAEFARLQQGKYVLQYRNGEDWYDVHPLLHAEVAAGGDS